MKNRFRKTIIVNDDEIKEFDNNTLKHQRNILIAILLQHLFLLWICRYTFTYTYQIYLQLYLKYKITIIVLISVLLFISDLFKHKLKKQPLSTLLFILFTLSISFLLIVYDQNYDVEMQLFSNMFPILGWILTSFFEKSQFYLHVYQHHNQYIQYQQYFQIYNLKLHQYVHLQHLHIYVLFYINLKLIYYMKQKNIHQLHQYQHIQQYLNNYLHYQKQYQVNLAFEFYIYFIYQIQLTVSMDQTHKSVITEILPNTKRTLERRQKQLEEEEKRKKEQESQIKEQAEKQKKFQQYLIEQERIKKQEEDRKKEEEKRSQEEIQQMNTLKGEYGNMMIDLATDGSKLDYTISGLDLRPTQIRVLVKVTENNNTLKGLSMSRKRIADEEGQEIAASLEKNMVLERLELEGNNLGPKTLVAIAKLLETNKSIRVIDLESNNLTAYDKDKNTYDYSGIMALCEALEKNDTLLQLNLCNCRLDEKCSTALANALKDNHSLILVDITENPKMILSEVRRCQDYLMRNKKMYDDERYREFQERQRIRNEDQTSTIQMQDKEKTITAQEGIEQRMNARRQELEQQWREELEKEAKIKEKTVHNLMKQAKLLGKKKGKGGGAKKK